MRILWFTNTPSNASFDFGFQYFGGGWISALEDIVATHENYKLGICFFYKGTEYRKIRKENVDYYGIPLKEGNALKRIMVRQLGILEDTVSSYFDEVIEDFAPDLIHVFGTEMGYGKILMGRFDKVLFHLQGLVAPYADVFFPPRFDPVRLFQNSSLNSMLRGLTHMHEYRFLRKRADREKEVIRYWKYFSGRTDWDRNYITLLNPQAHYFHCNELLRKDFFENEWLQPNDLKPGQPLVLGTTINPNLYKGLDLVYEVMGLLANINLEWHIYGISEDEQYNTMVKKIVKPDQKVIRKIRFHGQISSAELIKQLKTCHLFVHPSYIDNSPNSVCEAMLLGMPVVASSVGGVRSLISDRESGFLFNPYDKYDLAGLLADLMKNYSKAVQAGRKARMIAEERHAPASILADLDFMYHKISSNSL